MSSIKAFRAIRYNPEKINDLGDVLCPPYDVILPKERTALANLSPHNFVHIILSQDTAQEDRYKRAKGLFSQWRDNGILIQDEQPAVYFCRQDYKAMGQKYSRLGFISLMRLHDDDKSKVRPHENTHTYAFKDRLRLWRNLNANLSCIFVCYADKAKNIENIFNRKVASQKPLVDVTDHDGVTHRLWRFDDTVLIGEINSSIGDQNLFIADGHHRYRVAQEIRSQKLARMTGKPTGDEPFNYVMTYFTNIESRDLQILPMHRIIKTFPCDLTILEEYFRIDRMRSKTDLLIALARSGRNEHAFGLYTNKGGVRLLRLRNKLLVDQHIQEGSMEYKHLDAVILKHFIFDRINIKSEHIIYTKEFKEVTGVVDRGEADAGLILNPVSITQLKAIALNGERMPPKTTYFYPKILSGLTVYTMD